MTGTVLVFGSASLVGSDFTAQAASRFEVHAAGRTDPATRGLRVHRFDRIDLADERAVRAFLAGRSGDLAWVNFAARTDVDGCEAERTDGSVPTRSATSRSDSAWQLNAALPGWIAEESARRSTPFFHLSTDFVFDGHAGPYDEAARPSPFGPKVSWYGHTKAVGEERIARSKAPALILRISYPFRARFVPKSDFARNLLDRARSGKLFPLYSDQRFTPTWIPDVTSALTELIGRGETGILHLASPEFTTPLEFARCLFEEFGVDPGSIPEALLGDLPAVAGRAPRPLRGGLALGRAMRLGLSPLSFREGIRRMARELSPAAPG